MSEPEPRDLVKELLVKRAISCLDHVRIALFGEAVANYTVMDAGYKMEILVKVTCYTDKPAPAPVVPQKASIGDRFLDAIWRWGGLKA